MNIKLLNEITRINGLLQMLNENVESLAAKYFKSIVGGMDEINFKKLFKSFANEEEQAYKTLTKGTSSLDEMELAVEKLLKKIDFSKLAKHLLENKQLGSQIDVFIKNKMKNVKLGNISEKDALADIEMVLNTWAESQGIKELGPALSKRVKSKLSKIGQSIGNASGKIANSSASAAAAAEAEAQKLILALNEDAKKLFTTIIDSINNLKSKGLGTDVVVDINKINQAATEIVDGSIAKNGDFVSIGLELKKLGIALQDEIKKVTDLKIAQKGALDAADKLAVEKLSSATNWFNSICNTVFDFIKGNKILSWMFKKIVYLLIGITVLIALLVKTWNYLTSRICSGDAAFILKSAGFCKGSQSSESQSSGSQSFGSQSFGSQSFGSQSSGSQSSGSQSSGSQSSTPQNTYTIED